MHPREILCSLGPSGLVCFWAMKSILFRLFEKKKEKKKKTHIPYSMPSFVLLFAGMVLIDRCGRRRLLMFSLSGVIIALAVLTAAFHLTSHDSPAINFNVSSEFSHLACPNPSLLPAGDCNKCIQAKPGCGFCAAKGNQVRPFYSDPLFPHDSISLHIFIFIREDFLGSPRLCQCCCLPSII